MATGDYFGTKFLLIIERELFSRYINPGTYQKVINSDEK